jgi:hypothetical protein
LATQPLTLLVGNLYANNLIHTEAQIYIKTCSIRRLKQALKVLKKNHSYKSMITKAIKGGAQIKKKKKASGFGKLIIGSIFASP